MRALNTINERIKQIRKEQGLTQTSFGECIGATKNAVVNMELSGRAKVSEAYIKAICMAFDVSEDWLRTGEGTPYIQKTREEQLTDAVNRLLSGENPEFKRRLVMVLSALDDSQWSFLEEKLLEIVGHREVEIVPTMMPEHSVPMSEAEIEENVAAYRALLKKGRAVRLALGHGTQPQTKASGSMSNNGTGNTGDFGPNRA